MQVPTVPVDCVWFGEFHVFTRCDVSFFPARCYRSLSSITPDRARLSACVGKRTVCSAIFIVNIVILG